MPSVVKVLLAASDKVSSPLCLEIGRVLADEIAERFHVVHRSFGKNAVA
jgi:hypothetical protein